jgi:hypothetical protein
MRSGDTTQGSGSMAEIATRELEDGELEIEMDGRFVLAVFEYGGVWSGGRTGASSVVTRATRRSIPPSASSSCSLLASIDWLLGSWSRISARPISTIE